VRFPPGPRRAGRAVACLALLTATAAPLVTAPATPALAATAPRAATAPHSGRASLCRRYQHLAVTTAQGGHFVVKNDNFGGNRECLSVRRRWPNFTVTHSPVPRWHVKPQAYPFILRGCSWGTCSADSGLPRRVSALRRPEATWDTTQVRHGRWDAAFDIWIGRHPMTTGQARGAELMIWLGARRIGVPARTPVVRIDHARWYLLHWRACHLGDCWNYFQFRRARPVLGVRHLPLLPFIRRGEERGWVSRGWWLENIEAGFELWQGGRGLATDWFWARP
jgi:hypothetical protein